MLTSFVAFRENTAEALRRYETPALEKLICDRWLASSMLQKAIRRGEGEIAVRAATALFEHIGSAIWRRLLVIAFEDIGIGSPEAVITTAVVCSDANLRKKVGEIRAYSYLCGLLARVPKERSADYLICAARSHPSLADTRESLKTKLIPQRLMAVADEKSPLALRATAAWYSSGLEWRPERRVGTGDLWALLEVFRRLGIPPAIIDATAIATRITREPITVLLPLIWLHSSRFEALSYVEELIPRSVITCGIPSYALDKHTRLGRAAIKLFAEQNKDFAAALNMTRASVARTDIANMTAFYADAAPVSRKRDWVDTNELEQLGLESDFFPLGITKSIALELIGLVRGNLDHLNAIRSEILSSCK